MLRNKFWEKCTYNVNEFVYSEVILSNEDPCNVSEAKQGSDKPYNQ